MTTTAATRTRDAYVDFLRAVSLLVVVVWHWVFTIVVWHHDGPHASNPIGTTRGLWIATWLLQVMPVFFWVGGFVHLRTWTSIESRGGGYGEFLRRRLGRLLGPAAACVVVVVALVVAVRGFGGPQWAGRAALLILSPLWFLMIYVALVLLTPLAVRAHRLGGEVVLVLLAGLAIVVDVLRFRYHWHGVELANLVIVWGLAHQLGFFHERLVAASRRLAWCLLLGGLFALFGLTNMGLYPRSMVGVPGEAISNMGPPTLCIVALTLLQVGAVLLVRDWVRARLERPAVQRFTTWMAANAMTVFLWHAVGFALAYGLLRLAGVHAPQRTTATWWAQRPLWATAPIVTTAPLLFAFRRVDRAS